MSSGNKKANNNNLEYHPTSLCPASASATHIWQEAKESNINGNSYIEAFCLNCKITSRYKI